jgi:hypothetical protein
MCVTDLERDDENTEGGGVVRAGNGAPALRMREEDQSSVISGCVNARQQHGMQKREGREREGACSCIQRGGRAEGE